MISDAKESQREKHRKEAQKLGCLNLIPIVRPAIIVYRVKALTWLWTAIKKPKKYGDVTFVKMQPRRAIIQQACLYLTSQNQIHVG
jgi:hypothetical protein